MATLLDTIRNQDPYSKSDSIVSWIKDTMLYDISIVSETNKIIQSEVDFLQMMIAHQKIATST